MENETNKSAFYVGQPVETSFGGVRKTGKLYATTGHFRDMWLIDLDEGGRIQRGVASITPIQSDPIPQPAAIQYPPLRVLIDGKPSQTWQQVLESKPLAASQPHLYLAGYYEFVDATSIEMISFLNQHPHTLMFDFNPPLDSDNESDFGSYRVFIITEGA